MHGRYLHAMTSAPDADHAVTGSESYFRERLWPSPGWILAIGAFVAMIAIAYGAALGSVIGWVVGGGLLLLAGFTTWRSSPVVVIDDHTVLMASSAPLTVAEFRRNGLDVVPVDISEFEKLEGCVTCLSVRIRA